MRERFIEIGRNRFRVTCRVRRRNVMYEDTVNEKETFEGLKIEHHNNTIKGIKKDSSDIRKLFFC